MIPCFWGYDALKNGYDKNFFWRWAWVWADFITGFREGGMWEFGRVFVWTRVGPCYCGSFTGVTNALPVHPRNIRGRVSLLYIIE